MTGEHFDDARDAVGFGEAGVTPGGGVIVAQDVHFGQGGVGRGEIGVEADGFEEESEGFLGLESDAVQLRQVIVGIWVRWLTSNPGTLLQDMRLGLAIEGEIDDLLAPEAHFPRLTCPILPESGGHP